MSNILELNNGESGFLIPVPENSSIIPALGQVFDLTACSPDAKLGFEVSEDDLKAIVKEGSNTVYNKIYDNNSFQSEVNASLNVEAGGWGANTGFALDASAFNCTDDQTFTLFFSGYQYSEQKILPPSQPLSATAKKVLDSGYSNFIEVYGSHFIAGFIYGKSCKLCANYSFNSIDEKASFVQNFNDNVSELGFNESVKESISASIIKSKANSKTSFTTNIIGFSPSVSADSFEHYEIIVQDFTKSQNSKTPIWLIVYPWTYLDEISESQGTLSNNEALKDFWNTYNQLSYMYQSCTNFINNKLYAGNTQLQRVKKIKSNIFNLIDTMNSTLGNALRSGVNIQSNDVPNDWESIYDDFIFALKNFVVRIYAKFDPTSHLRTVDPNFKDINNEPVILNSSNNLDYTNIYLTWSTEGNDEWSGTINTQKKLHRLVQITGSGYLNIITDRDKGTIQLWYTGFNETLEQNIHGDPKIARSSANDKELTSPDNYVVATMSAPPGVYLASVY